MTSSFVVQLERLRTRLPFEALKSLAMLHADCSRVEDSDCSRASAEVEYRQPDRAPETALTWSKYGKSFDCKHVRSHTLYHLAPHTHTQLLRCITATTHVSGSGLDGATSVLLLLWTPCMDDNCFALPISLLEVVPEWNYQQSIIVHDPCR